MARCKRGEFEFKITKYKYNTLHVFISNSLVMDTRRIALLAGVGAVVSAHVAILADYIPWSQKNMHSYAMIASAALIAFGAGIGY